MNYSLRYKFLLVIILLSPLALANDAEIIKNLDFYLNYEAFASEDFEELINDENKIADSELENMGEEDE